MPLCAVTDMPAMKNALSLAMTETAYTLPPVLPVNLIGYGFAEIKKIFASINAQILNRFLP